MLELVSSVGDPEIQHQWNLKGSLRDDPSWLPYGPAHRNRTLPDGSKVYRYQEGYLGYAGGGNHSRGTQLIVALRPNPYLGGGSPWEVPFGQLIGAESYDTIHKVSSFPLTSLYLHTYLILNNTLYIYTRV